ncbi:Helicase associated domain (HA2) [Parelaphostrongylus tenuis]|uniref:Helicase associated domain (HA2) n=1 Tax=Parelaphostrongylus tenuis TaxID=148309 RepID=A0AAD5QK66_PARTN|nr:Helicase associated domain (HA2) [Parelaphostrongylus tenuis]
MVWTLTICDTPCGHVFSVIDVYNFQAVLVVIFLFDCMTLICLRVKHIYGGAATESIEPGMDLDRVLRELPQTSATFCCALSKRVSPLWTGNDGRKNGNIKRVRIEEEEESRKRGRSEEEGRGDRNADQEKLETRRRFISNYFDRFIRNGGESGDHFDLKRLRRDDYGIPQDISKRYFVFAQKEFQDQPAHLSHISPWLIRHFEYAVQLSLDFSNDLKFKKMKDLRKSQRELPIAERKREILQLLENNQVLIIAGDTGCGKSTQVPQYLLQNGYTGIACTQPRRIACTSLARRVAYETLNACGSEVAYQIK